MAPVANDPTTLADSIRQDAPAVAATVVSAAKRQAEPRLTIPLQLRDDFATDPKLLQRMELLRKEVSELSRVAQAEHVRYQTLPHMCKVLRPS